MSKMEAMTEETESKAKKLPQYFAALVVSLGGFALGSSLGWSAMTEPHIREELQRPSTELAWINGALLLGGASVMLPLPFVLNHIGRKTIMAAAVGPLVAAWVVICVASQMADATTAVALYCIGQFVAGMCEGMFCVSVPIYICEIAKKELRGKLAFYFELYLTLGLLYAFVVGSFTTVLGLSIACGVVPITFGALLIFIPESPQYLVMRNQLLKAEHSLVWFRGRDYDIKTEMNDIQTEMAERQKENGSFGETLAIPGTKKALVIGVGSMLCQVSSGINAVTLHMKLIFDMTGSTIPSNYSLIIIAAMQVVATSVSTVTVDKTGRKFTLFVSMAVMGVCHLFLGTYFLFYSRDNHSVDSISWLPLVVVCVFFLGYSFGAGPTPWVIVGEIFPNSIKNVAVPVCVFLNWFLGFVVAFSFNFIIAGLDEAGPFWMYATTCALGAVFVLLVCVETKGKTLQEIQTHLAGGNETK